MNLLTDESLGQWAPIVGTALAVVGSLYLLLSADIEAAGKEDGQQEETIVGKCRNCDCAVSDTGSSSRRESRANAERQDPDIEMTTIRRPTTNQTIGSQADLGGRRKVARFLMAASAIMTTKAHNQIEKTGFKPEAKTTYPETPGERYKNSDLQKQIDKYQRSSTPDNRSRAASFISNGGSVDNGEGSSRRPRSPTRRSVPTPAISRPKSRQAHSNSLPSGGIFGSSTLQCPPVATFAGWQRRSSPSNITPISRSRAPSMSDVSPTTSSPRPQSTPEIVISPDEDS